MDYEKTEPFSGNVEKVLEVAKNVFIQHNFQIVRDSDTEVEFTGPGMLSSRQNPIVGISRICIRGTSGNPASTGYRNGRQPAGSRASGI